MKNAWWPVVIWHVIANSTMNSFIYFSSVEKAERWLVWTFFIRVCMFYSSYISYGRSTAKMCTAPAVMVKMEIAATQWQFIDFAFSFVRLSFSLSAAINFYDFHHHIYVFYSRVYDVCRPSRRSTITMPFNCVLYLSACANWDDIFWISFLPHFHREISCSKVMMIMMIAVVQRLIVHIASLFPM